MSSVTKDGDKSIDIILDIGEALAAMGKGQAELDRIVVNLQQVGAIGYASMIDIKQFAYAGIPIFEMLQEQTGLSGEALANFISEGKVSFEMLTTMFDKANDEGGKFFNAYQNQSGTLTQSWSNMKDAISLASAEFVKQSGIMDLAKEAMDRIISAMDQLSKIIKPVIEFLKENEIVLYAIAGALFAACIPALWGLVAAFAAGAIALAPWLFGGLIAGIVSIVKNWDETKESLKFIWEVIKGIWKSGVDWVKDQIDKLIGFFDNLIEKIKDAIEWLKKYSGYNLISSGVGKVVNTVSGVFGGARAAGGPVTSGRSYLVGEQGPELFTPGTSGRIIPNGGSGGVTVNITVNGDVSGREIIEKVKRSIEDETFMNTKWAYS